MCSLWEELQGCEEHFFERLAGIFLRGKNVLLFDFWHKPKNLSSVLPSPIQICRTRIRKLLHHFFPIFSSQGWGAFPWQVYKGQNFASSGENLHQKYSTLKDLMGLASYIKQNHCRNTFLGPPA